MIEDLRWWNVPAIVVPAALCAPAYAMQYLTVEQAQQLLFPQAERFVAAPVQLDREQVARVEGYSGVRLRVQSQPAWRVQLGEATVGWFFVDEVYGKHEFITYAVGIDTAGRVTGVEILDYRETHGGEVRNAAWRAQFIGAGVGDELALGGAIGNISGATLSCKHITEGVRRLLAIHAEAVAARSVE